MHVLLFLGGFVFVVTGFAALGFGVNEHRLTGASALILPGAIGAVGGLLLLGFGSVVARLSRITEILETQPLPRSVITAPEIVVGTVMPPAEVDKTDATAAAPEVQPPIRASDAAPREAPAVMIDPPAQDRSATARSEVPPAERTNGGGPAARPPEPPAVAPLPAAAPQPVPIPVPSPRTNGPAGPPPQVLKSGVIEGMAYTLYSDGAVDAELPQHGTMRFPSISQWRAYIRGEQ